MLTEKRIGRAILGVSGIVLLSKLFGFLREMVIAERFGTSREYDILLIGIAAPAFFNLVMVNATNFLIVPFLSRKMGENADNSGWRSFWGLFNSLFLAVGLLVVAIILIAPLLVKIISPSLSGSDLVRAVSYCRIISLMVILAFMESFLRSALNVKKEFAYPAAGTIVFNIVAIAIIYLFSGEMSVLAILLGLLLGYVLQIIFLFVKLLGFDILKHFHFDLFSRDIKQLFAVGGIVVMVELLARTYFLIDRYYASDLATGIVSALNYCSLLVMLPVSIAGFAISSVTFPYLSDGANNNQDEKFKGLLHATLRLSLTIGLAGGIFYLFFAKELTAAIFLRGAFNLDSLAITSNILIFLAPHLTALFMYTILIQACYALGRQKYILLIAAIAVILKIVLTGLLKDLIGYPGIALATSIVEILTILMMFIILVRDKKIIGASDLALTVVKVIGSCIPTIGLVFLYRNLPNLGPGMGAWSRFRVVPAILFSAVGFIAIGYLVNIVEIRRLLGRFINKSSS